MECKTININEIEQNDFILNPKYYIEILPYLEQEFNFKNYFSGGTEKIKLNLNNFSLREKLFIYYLLKQKEKYNKINMILRE